MGLSSKEKKMLESLQRKAEQPDAPPIGKNLNINLDLGNPEQVAMAKRYGFLPDDDDDDDDDGDGDDEDKDDTPKRRGYFT